MRRRQLAAITVATIVAAALVAQADARMTVVYDETGPAERLLTGPSGLGPGDGAFRQAPGVGGLFRDGDEPYLIAKVRAEQLKTMTTQQMIDVLKREIDAPTTPGAGSSHLVAVDEIGNAFRDPRTKVRFKWVTVGSHRYRIAAQNRIEATKLGWRLVKQTLQPKKPGPNHVGSRLSAAMAELTRTESPWGGSYASRVHFYLAPAFVTSVAAGRGRHFTQSRDGRLPIRGGWQGVIPGIAASGGVWLEMYHGSGHSVSALTWRMAARRFGGYLTRYGGTPDRLHFMMTGATEPPPGSGATCAPAVQCMWALARRGYNLRVLNNGPGVWRAGDQASIWLGAYRVHFDPDSGD
jgi:hypothetical protein